MIDFDRAIAGVHEQIERVQKILVGTRGDGVINPRSMRAVSVQNFTELLEELHVDLRKWEAQKAALTLTEAVPVEAN